MVTPNSSGPLRTLDAIINSTLITKIFSDLISNPTAYLLNNDHECVQTSVTDLTQAELYARDCNQAKTHLLETILAVVLTDGLSRHGSVHSFTTGSRLEDWYVATFEQTPDYPSVLLQQGGKAYFPPPDLSLVYQLDTAFFVTGYAYYASAVTDYLAQAVVGLYALIATAHLLWLLFSRVSSSAWETVTELIALCQNSPPTAALRGTSAGITCLSTYTRIVRLGVMPMPEEGGDERVVLLFGDDDEEVDLMDRNAKKLKHRTAPISVASLLRSLTMLFKKTEGDDSETARRGGKLGTEKKYH